jgi:hypothetical protein
MLCPELLPKRHEGMLEQLKAPRLGPKTPGVIDEINE